MRLIGSRILIVFCAFNAVACAGVKSISDNINGKKAKVAPFQADANQLPGQWIVSEFSQGSSWDTIQATDGANQEIWFFDNGVVTTYRTSLAERNCKEDRPFHIQGNDILAIDAKGSCLAESFKVTRLDSGLLAIVSERTANGKTFS